MKTVDEYLAEAYKKLSLGPHIVPRTDALILALMIQLEDITRGQLVNPDHMQWKMGDR